MIGCLTKHPCPSRPQVWQGYTPRHFQSSKGAAANKFSGGACKTGNTLDYNMDDILVKKFEDATEKALKKVWLVMCSMY